MQQKGEETQPGTASTVDSTWLEPLELCLRNIESVDSLIVFPETNAGYISQVHPLPEH